MKQYTVKALARLSGISVRTLHHYDEIGLLKPAFTDANRYRYYGRDELLRLQQILFHRELGLPLQEIARLLDTPDPDRIAALGAQRAHLEREAQRFRRLIRTIDRTIAELKGDRVMKDSEIYQGFTPEKQAEYETWLVGRYGSDMKSRIADSKVAYAGMGKDGQAAAMAELADFEAAMVEGMRRGVPAGSPALDLLVARQRDWVATMWGRPCPPAAIAGLADLHLSHPDFVRRYQALAPGFSDYHAAAMKAWAARQDA